LLNQMIETKEFSRTFVIINEFGEIGLDHQLNKSSNENMIEMSSGCICCTIRGDLRTTLKDIHWRFSRGGEQQFDRVFIETTGLADPAPIVHTIMTSPELLQLYSLHSVISTIDATSFLSTEDKQFEAHKQCAMADSLILTKTDLIDEVQKLEVEKRLRELNPASPVLISEQGKIDTRALFASRTFTVMGKGKDVTRWLQEEAYHNSCQHTPDHEPDVNKHGEHIKSFCITHDQPILEEGLMLWIELIMSLMGEKMLRVKGLINVEGYEGPMVIHGVQHIFYPFERLEEWPTGDKRTRIVFITRGLNKDPIAASFRSFCTEESKAKIAALGNETSR
jgi:G3E family GTPase